MTRTGKGPELRFVTANTARIERAVWGKHWWLSEPDLTGTRLLTLVRVTMRPGTGHRFHYHPSREEIIYIVDGVAEQWVDREKRRLKAGECAFIPARVVHAIFNSSKKPMTFLAILSPAKARGPFLVDCYDEERWRSLRRPRRLATASATASASPPEPWRRRKHAKSAKTAKTAKKQS